MTGMTYETLRKRISEELNAGIREFSKTIGDVTRNFRSLGLETAVWHPDMIHSANLGGILAESYLGYSRVEGRWGLIVRTVERDSQTLAFIAQRVYTLESSHNMEILVGALKKVSDLLERMARVTDRQLEILAKPDADTDALRSPDYRFQQ